MNFLRRIGDLFLKKRKPFIYVALGDSTIEGIGATKRDNSFSHLVFQAIKKKIKNVEYYNFGKKGARVREVLEIQVAKAVELKPDLIVVSVGANDIFKFTRKNVFVNDYKNLIHTLSTDTDAKIVVNNIPDITVTPFFPGVIHPLLRYRIKEYNAVIEKSSRGIKGILVDLYQESGVYKGFKGLVSEDKLHFSDIGHAIWASIVVSKTLPLFSF